MRITLFHEYLKRNRAKIRNMWNFNCGEIVSTNNNWKLVNKNNKIFCCQSTWKQSSWSRLLAYFIHSAYVLPVNITSGNVTIRPQYHVIHSDSTLIALYTKPLNLLSNVIYLGFQYFIVLSYVAFFLFSETVVFSPQQEIGSTLHVPLQNHWRA